MDVVPSGKMSLRHRLRVVAPYLAEVFVRSKLALSGSLAIILVVLIEWGTGHSLSRNWHIAAIILAVIAAQLWHGLVQFERMHPPFRVIHPKQQFWDEANRKGLGYYFEVSNPSDTGSLESVRAQLIAIEPADVSNLPIPLHIRHKLYSTSETEISIGPRGVVGFDIATGPDHGEICQKQVLIPCVVGGDKGVIMCAQIPHTRHHLTIRVTARNYYRDIELDVWVEDNFLRCEPRQTYVMEHHLAS